MKSEICNILLKSCLLPSSKNKFSKIFLDIESAKIKFRQIQAFFYH